MTVSEIQEAISKIEQGIANSTIIQSMTFGDQTFQFRSMDDMLAGLAYFKRLLAAAQGRSSSRLAAFRKGA